MKKVISVLVMVIMVMALGGLPVMAREAEVPVTETETEKVSFKEVVDEIESWEVTEEYVEHLVSVNTRVDYAKEDYDRHYYFDDSCDIDHSYVIVHTWNLGGTEHQEVFMCVEYRDGSHESVSWDSYAEFAEEFM